jgi:hypothetical protein
VARDFRSILHGPAVDQVLADEVFTAGGGGQRVSDEVLWLLADHQGTIRDMADGDGNLASHVDCGAFGQITSFPVGGPEQLFYYTGQEYDESTGFYSYNARWYNPDAGRSATRPGRNPKPMCAT